MEDVIDGQQMKTSKKKKSMEEKKKSIKGVPFKITRKTKSNVHNGAGDKEVHSL